MPSAKRDMTEAHAEITKRITDLPPNYLDCRDPGLAHAWSRESDFHVIEQVLEPGSQGKAMYLGRDSVCMRCNCHKHEKFIVTKSGMSKVRSSYEYPEGYLMPGVPRGVKPSGIIYAEQYRRAMQQVAHAANMAQENAGS